MVPASAETLLANGMLVLAVRRTCLTANLIPGIVWNVIAGVATSAANVIATVVQGGGVPGCRGPDLACPLGTPADRTRSSNSTGL